MMQNDSQFIQACLAVDRLIEKAKCLTSTKMKSAVVSLYTAMEQNPLRYSGVIGMLHLDMDRSVKNTVLRLYDLESLILLLQVEMYYGFDQNYRMITEKLYVFDYFVDGIIGFQFYRNEDAREFYEKIKSAAPKISQFQQKHKQILKQRQKDCQKKGYLSMLKKRVKTIFRDEQQQQQIVQQSQVLNVQKNRSIKYDTDTGSFSTSNIPPQWLQIFAVMNLSNEELMDKDIARMIIEETIIHQSRQYMLQNPSQQLKVHLDVIDQQQSAVYEESHIISEQKKIDTIQKVNTNLPVPPPIGNLSPPPLSLPLNTRAARQNLMIEIRNNNFKMKPVKTTEKGYEIDASAMNRQERMDLAEHLKLRLKKRREALNRRKQSDSQ